MRWLTKKEIARRAKKSYKEALVVSIEHHQQIAQSTRQEFFTAVGSGKVSISSGHCGLCCRKPSDSCRDCFLKGFGGCGPDWKDIRNAIGEILTDEDSCWSKVVKAEKNMIKVLKKELKRIR